MTSWTRAELLQSLFNDAPVIPVDDPPPKAQVTTAKTYAELLVELEELAARPEDLSIEEFVARAREVAVMAGIEGEFERLLESARRQYAPAPRPELPTSWGKPAIPPRLTQRPPNTSRS